MPCDAVNTARSWLLVFTVNVRVAEIAKGNGLSQVMRQQFGQGCLGATVGLGQNPW